MKKIIVASLIIVTLNVSADSDDDDSWGNNGWNGQSMPAPNWFGGEMDGMMNRFDSDGNRPWGNNAPWSNQRWNNNDRDKHRSQNNRRWGDDDDRGNNRSWNNQRWSNNNTPRRHNNYWQSRNPYNTQAPAK